MKNKRLFFIALCFSMPFSFLSSALAGNDRGNGGIGVFCDGEVKGEVLDHYLARVMYDEPASYVAGTWSEYLEQIFTKLEKINPSRVQLYRQWLASFSNEAQFTQEPLEFTEDWGVYPLPAECSIKQLAIQPDKKLPGEPVYILSLPLWNLLDEENKAILVLHEMVYREVLAGFRYERIVEDSDTVRMYVSLLASQRMASLSLHTYYNFLNQYTYLKTMDSHDGKRIALFEFKEILGQYVDVIRFPVNFHSEGIVASAQSASGCDMTWDEQGNFLSCQVKYINTHKY